MSANSDGEEDGKKKRKYRIISGGNSDKEKYSIYTKPNYKRLFIENSNNEYTVFVESVTDEKLGNKNPIILTNTLSENVIGIAGVHRVNATKIGVTFKKAAAANNFLKMEDFLSKHKMRAFIPSYLTERIGVLRYVPKDLSNETIYKNIVCDTEVISVKRFMKKVDGKLVPLSTVAITFASTNLPQYAYIKLYRYEVQTYIAPLLQCYKCLKFNHSAKVCRGEQNCSSCAGRHSYKECDVEEVICINCSGNHLAVSRDCPVKKKKMEEKKKKCLQQSYATVVSTPAPPPVNDNTFPSLPSQPVKNNDKFNIKQLAENDIVINAIVKSLVTLGNLTSTPLTTKKIKEIFLSNLV